MKPRETYRRNEKEHARNRPQSPLKSSSSRCSEAPPDHKEKENEFAQKWKSDVEKLVAQPVTPKHHIVGLKKCDGIDGTARIPKKSQSKVAKEILLCGRHPSKKALGG